MSFIMRCLLLCFLVLLTVRAQTIYVGPKDKVYSFLERQWILGIIDFDDIIRPKTRRDIAGKLIELRLKENLLTNVEREELYLFCEEYEDDIEIISNEKNVVRKTDFFSFTGKYRFRTFRYKDDIFYFNADPVVGYKLGSRENSSAIHRWNGLKLNGYIGKHLGFQLNFRDNLESGENIDRTREFTNQGGINIQQSGEKWIEYSSFNASVTWMWDWGILSCGKENVEWGNSFDGSLIFSSKPPSFPLIKLEITPASWIKFFYFHGWLRSGLPDSSYMRETLVENRKNFSQIEKYIAAHMILLKPFRDIQLGLGESVIYSDKIELLYLIPVSFFRLSDHYMTDGKSDSGDNLQIFASISYRNQEIRTKFYSTLFIDEFSVTDIFNDDQVSAVGYSLGFESSGLIADASELNFDYTRLNPYVYLNSNDAHLYTSHGYPLGHWIGSNADKLHLSYKKHFSGSLSWSLSAEYLRKGEKENPEGQYRRPYPPFLFGLKYRSLGFLTCIEYEPIYDLVFRVDFEHKRISEKGIAGSWLNKHFNNFSFSVYYSL